MAAEACSDGGAELRARKWLAAAWSGFHGDFPRDAEHIRGLPCKYIFVGAKEVDERAFLLRREGGSDPRDLGPRGAKIERDLLGVLDGLEGSGFPVRIQGLLFHGRSDGLQLLLKGNDGHREFAALYLALVGALKRATYADDPLGS